MRFGWAAALASLLLAGCAALQPAPPVDADAPPASTAVEVVAPAPLKLLLERYLDLARVGRFAREDTIDDAEWSRLIDAAPAQVRELLETEGYFAPEVELTGETTPEGQRRVRLVLDPGPRTVVDRVTFEVGGDLGRDAAAGDPYANSTLEALRKAWAMPAGAPFRNPDWTSAKAAALARLRAAGYAGAQWSGTGAEVDRARHRVRLFLVADSGPLFRFGELQIEGVVRQDEDTLRHLAGIERGTPVSDQALLDYQERLQKTGLFDTVSVTLEPDAARAETARVLVRVREAALQVWVFAVGVSANNGPRVTVENTYRRVFGTAATARNKVEWSRVRQAWDGEVSTHPGEDFYRHLVGGAVERLKSDADVVLSQRLRVGRARETQRVEGLAFVEAERSERKTLAEPSVRTETLALSANYQGLWRRLDSILLPTEGFTLALQGGLGHSNESSGESGPFSRLYGRLTGYLPIGSRWYGQARVELGQVFKRDTLGVPESQLFRAGGDESVRGYAYRSLGPIVDGAVAGGASLVTASAEIARPLTDNLPSLWGAVFVDAGQAANSFNGMQLALGGGVGVRWRSPVGPLRADLAYGRDVHKLRVHFSVGISY